MAQGAADEAGVTLAHVCVVFCINSSMKWSEL